MAEWFNALVLKTNVKKFTEGSNPSLSCITEKGFSGLMPEWLKGADCKSAGLAYVGSKPTSSTTARA